MLILVVVIVWRSGYKKGSFDKNLNDITPRNYGETAHSRDDSSAIHKKSTRPSQAKPSQVEVADQLEDIAKASPRLIERFNLAMFDNNLNPNLKDWELLGLNKEDAEVVSNDLKSIFQKIKDKEVNSFSIIDQTENRVQISIPKFGNEDAAKHLAQIENSYAKVFGPELSKQMTRLFVDTHSAIAGGINGRDRVITITTASADVISKTNRKYEIRTQTLFEGTKLSDALGNLANYSQDEGIELVEAVPDSWAHLFGNSD